MRRCLATGMVAVLLVLVACTSDEPEPGPTTSGASEDEDADGNGNGAQGRPLPGLRVGVVLPPRGLGSADEIEAGALGLDALAASHDEVGELRIVVPDGADFVPDIAGLLVAEGYDVVCVLGRQARDVTQELAQRHGATEFCGAPAQPTDEGPQNLLLVDVALAELGHAVGVALGALGGEQPVALLGAGNRASGEAFRSGLRAGVGGTPLREARGDLEALEAELDAALGAEVAAIAVDAGPEAAELVAGTEGVALLAPVPLLTEQHEGALRWRVRWEVVLEAVLAHLLDDEVELPAVLGVREDVFALDHGPQAGSAVVAAVEEAMGELERGARDPLEAVEADDGDDADGADEDDDGADDDGDAEGDVAQDAADPGGGAADGVPVPSAS